MIQRYQILNIWADAVTMDQALAKVIEFVEKGQKLHTIFASNPEKNFSVPKDPLVYDAFKKADLLIPDGIGMVVAARFLYGAKLRRVTGCDLMQRICGLSAKRGYGVFIYGATEEVNADAALRLTDLYPGLMIAGRANGYLAEGEMPSLVRRINDSKADILFLALGSPKQEQWISRHESRLKHVRVCQGIGGTLDILAGTAKRAHRIIRESGLEWFFRLASDPRRIKRQSVLPLFVWHMMIAKRAMRRFRSAVG